MCSFYLKSMLGMTQRADCGETFVCAALQNRGEKVEGFVKTKREHLSRRTDVAVIKRSCCLHGEDLTMVPMAHLTMVPMAHVSDATVWPVAREQGS